MRVTTLADQALAPDGARRARPPFSVVVVTYNTERTNASCISSVLRTLGPVDELIVVDNASSDSTPEFLRSVDDPRVQVQLNADNVGYSIGMNQGLRLAGGEHIVLLNPDTEVPSRWLERMRTHFRDARVGAVGPLSDRAGGCQRFEFFLPSEMKGGFTVEEIAGRVYAANAGKALEAKTLIGFCIMVSRRAMDTVGLLDEDLVLGNDDLEYCLRLRLAGFKTVVATDVFVRHEEQVSFRTLPSETTRRMVQESTDALARKLLARYGKGKVPSSRALFGVDWFKPSFDLWEGAAQPRLRLSEFGRDPESGVYVPSMPLETPQGRSATGERLLALTWGALVQKAVAAGAQAVIVSAEHETARRAAHECRDYPNASVYCADPAQIDFEGPFESAIIEADPSLRDSLDAAAEALCPGGNLTLIGGAKYGRRELSASLLSAGFGCLAGEDVVTAVKSPA